MGNTSFLAQERLDNPRVLTPEVEQECLAFVQI